MQFCKENDHNEIPDDLNRLIRIIDRYFGYKARNVCVFIDEKELEYILYESFVLRFSIGDRYGVFGASIAMGNGFHGITNLLGKEISLNNDEESIIKNLKVIDDYCKLRLPDKFLETFNRVYK